MKLFTSLLILSFLLLPLQLRAENESLGRVGKKTMVVGKAAMYGAAGGLVVGLASQAFKSKTKNIFLFGSLGLYAGIALGVYAIFTSGKNTTPYEGPDTYEDYTGQFEPTLPSREQEARLALSQQNSQLNVLNVSF